MAKKTTLPKLPDGLLKKGWVSALVSLIVGLGLGTTLGREVLESAGIPESCVRTIQRATRAMDTGTEVADDGKAALAALRDLEVGRAGDLLAEARDGADTLVGLVQRFNEARKACDTDRK
jgi:hypothetical protein